MSGNLTAAQIHKFNRDPLADPVLLLVEIEELHSGSILRFARNNENVTSTVGDGSTSETWTAAAIEFARTGYGEEIKGVSISVSNVTRAAGRALILSSEPIRVRLIPIDYAAPNVALEDTLDLLYIASGMISPERVEAKLESVIDWSVPWPPYRITKVLFPGVFA